MKVPQTISKIEQGKMVPSFDKLFQIADFFKTTVDAMTGGVGPRTGTTTYIDAEFSASDGSMLFIGTQDRGGAGQSDGSVCAGAPDPTWGGGGGGGRGPNAGGLGRSRRAPGG